MTLTKANLIDNISEFTGFSKNRATRIVELTLEIMKKSLESSENVLISGFGKFSVNQKKARKGRNPATGADLMLPARKVVVFKCSGKLRDKINDG